MGITSLFGGTEAEIFKVLPSKNVLDLLLNVELLTYKEFSFSQQSIRKPREDSCPICCEKLNGKIGSPGNCNHFFCLDCISQWAKLFEKREGKIHRSDEDSIDLPENSIGSLNRLPLDSNRIDIDFSNVTEMLNSIDPEWRINSSRNLIDVRELLDQTLNPEFFELGTLPLSPMNGRELMRLIRLSNHSENH
ncbi:hypothetical protein Avbf_03474 [Armadillidium vulgare]|nr:hypothetical protein Avbf_03474 [Armadillidium vulgare]